MSDEQVVLGALLTWHMTATPRAEPERADGAVPTTITTVEPDSFAEGKRVRIVDGPFTECIGVIDEVNTIRNKLRALVDMFGRATPVDLDFLQVRKV